MQGVISNTNIHAEILAIDGMPCNVKDLLDLFLRVKQIQP
jgi:hypothetical protein